MLSVDSKQQLLQTIRFIILTFGLMISLLPQAKPSLAAGTITTLYTFTARDASYHNADGNWPESKLVQGSDGAFYGTVYAGGANDLGTIFKVTPAGILTPLHSFSDGPKDGPKTIYNSDGAYPQTGLVLGRDGNLYGTVTYGGEHANGTIYKITPSGVFTTLYSFSAFNTTQQNVDGANPVTDLVQGSDGAFYGTAFQGGAYGYGTVFKITSTGVFTTLYSFSAPDTKGHNMDGAYPMSTLVQESDGNFYGANQGGANGYGTIFKITPTGTLTILHSFSAPDANNHNTDGGYGSPRLLPAIDGSLYGANGFGGANGSGVIFKITLSGAFTTLHSFAAKYDDYYNSDGTYPTGLIQSSDGVFYGSTSGGGSSAGGTIFRLTSTGAFTTLYTFATTNDPMGDNADGMSPSAVLVLGADGKLYGTATFGGANAGGTVFRFDQGKETSVTLNPASLIGGLSSTGTITLANPAPAGGQIVTLKSSAACAVVPATITVGAGKTTATFKITTSIVGASTAAAIKAQIGNIANSAVLTVNPPAITGFVLASTSVVGGKTSTGTLTISVPAPAGGIPIKLTSSTTSAATVLATVTIPAGKTSAAFTVTTNPVAVYTVVTITGKLGIISKTANLTVIPPVVTGFAITPVSLLGGAAFTGTVTIGSIAPAGGLHIALKSSSNATPVPSTVTIAAGKMSATFTAKSIPVAAVVKSTLTATYGVSKTATLTVNPPAMTALTFVPTSVKGGTHSAATITLSGPPPAGGLVIYLASGNTNAVSVPLSVSVAAGKNVTAFTITTKTVTAKTAVAIKARLVNAYLSSTVTVTP